MKKIVAGLMLVLGLYGAFIIYQQSILAASIVVVLSLCLAVPFWLERRKVAAHRSHIGEKPTTAHDHGLRQARAMAMREEGEISGLPRSR